MSRVFVLSLEGTPLMPCHPARARIMVREGFAKFTDRRIPTIRLTYRTTHHTQRISVKIDPGAITTGVALTAQGKRGEKVIHGANLVHRGTAIRMSLKVRRELRSSRRSRTTRRRPARFDNRKRDKGWLPPSLLHKVHMVYHYIRRLSARTPIFHCFVEDVKFDISKMTAEHTDDPTAHKPTADYKPPTSMRKRLLLKYDHTCQYCHGASNDRMLQWDHIIPKAQGGNNREDNATLACRTCNQLKGNQTPKEFAATLTQGTPTYIQAVKANAPLIPLPKQSSLKYASQVQSMKTRLYEMLGTIPKPPTLIRTSETTYNLVPSDTTLQPHPRPSMNTSINRRHNQYPKDHWVDAAMVSIAQEQRIHIPLNLTPLTVTSRKTHNRRMVGNDKRGFPNTKPKGPSIRNGFRTDDLCLIDTTRTRAAFRGVTVAPIILAGKYVDFKSPDGVKVRTSITNVKILSKSSGYTYARGQSVHTLNQHAAARPAVRRAYTYA